jgi:hypothetical protein
MTVAIIIGLVAVLGIVVGYAARQREDLLTAQMLNEELTLENADLRQHNKSHESSLNLLLTEIDKSA